MFTQKNINVLLINIFTKTHNPTTPSQRFKKSTFLIKFSKPNKFFKIFLKNKAGRNNLGCITVFSKGLKKKYNSIPFKQLSTWDSRLVTVVSFFRNKKKILTLNKHISGSLSVKPCVLGTKLGQKTFISNLPQNFWFNKLPGNLVFLKYLTKYSIFSNIYINFLTKYSLSNGTYCQIIDIFNDFNLVKITLPSKQIKIISGWCFVITGRNSKPEFKYNRLGKAGVNFLTGRKSSVRGVAKNPVDHPHGGRTKTNQPEVSPWGWIAKRNK